MPTCTTVCVIPQDNQVKIIEKLVKPQIKLIQSPLAKRRTNYRVCHLNGSTHELTGLADEGAILKSENHLLNAFGYTIMQEADVLQAAFEPSTYKLETVVLWLTKTSLPFQFPDVLAQKELAITMFGAQFMLNDLLVTTGSMVHVKDVPDLTLKDFIMEDGEREQVCKDLKLSTPGSLLIINYKVPIVQTEEPVGPDDEQTIEPIMTDNPVPVAL